MSGAAGGGGGGEEWVGEGGERGEGVEEVCSRRKWCIGYCVQKSDAARIMHRSSSFYPTLLVQCFVISIVGTIREDRWTPDAGRSDLIIC
ncbi:hypothetical protein M0802_014153 [Mischocyttarus mexicanus]|nr:hypothetical protein M0802_014153 [Mischocyttarus mexicanus]